MLDALGIFEFSLSYFYEDITILTLEFWSRVRVIVVTFTSNLTNVPAISSFPSARRSLEDEIHGHINSMHVQKINKHILKNKIIKNK